MPTTLDDAWKKLNELVRHGVTSGGNAAAFAAVALIMKNFNERLTLLEMEVERFEKQLRR